MKIISGYLKSCEFYSTIVLNYELVEQLLLFSKSPYLDKLNLEEYNYIVGPYFISSQNHWNALIISIKDRDFLLLDPQNTAPSLSKEKFDSWCNYINQSQKNMSGEWKHKSPNHPIQKDYFNCGVFVILFIKNYIIKKSIDFDTNEASLINERSFVATQIENYCNKL